MTPLCVRCNRPATAVMSFDYASAHIWIHEDGAVLLPGAGYWLCELHTSRLTPPLGWALTDRRSSVRPLFPAVVA